MHEISTVIIHHSGRHNTPELIRELHVDKYGWDDIGYHYMIDDLGNIIKGRDESLVGAHAKGHNNNSIGICLLGDKDKEEIFALQLESLKWLVRKIKDRYHIKVIIGHRELPDVDKTCPGKKVDMDLLRKELI